MIHTNPITDRNTSTRHELSTGLLQCENRRYQGTGGTSRENRASGFVPAFLDTCTGQAYRSSFSDGRPAPMHILEGLPEHLLIKTSDALKAKEGIISGFLRCGEFLTRRQAAEALKTALQS
ncbi:MAG: hypothetical protein WBN68_18965 [Sedimenticolaceae bacterium]